MTAMDIWVTLAFCPFPKRFLIRTSPNSPARELMDEALSRLYTSHQTNVFQISMPGGKILEQDKSVEVQGVRDGMELIVEANIQLPPQHGIPITARNIAYVIGGMP